MTALRTTGEAKRHVLLAIIAFAVLSLAAGFSPAARALIVLVPLASFGFACYLHRRYPGHYVGLVCWLFFLTPLLKRIIELKSGPNTASAVMTSPFLACWAGMAILRHQQTKVFDRRLRSWLLVVGTLLYGVVVGLLSNPVLAVIQDWIGWSSPLCFSIYLYVQRAHTEELLDSFKVNMLSGVIVMGIYGLWQFFFITPWDTAWMENTDLTSIGFPEPMAVRVFSTMNSPQTFADFLVCGLLVGVESKRSIRYVAVPLAVLSIGLTLSRSAWICGFVGILILSFGMEARQRLRIFGVVLACVVVLAALHLPGLRDTLTARMESLTTLSEDTSLKARMANQQQAVDAFEESPFGMGLGVGAERSGSGPSFGVPRLSYVIGDNGIEQVLLSFGWFGSLIFAVGFAGAVSTVWHRTKDPQLLAMKSLLTAMVILIPAMGVFAGSSAFLMWTAIGMCFASVYAESEFEPKAAPAGEWEHVLIPGT